MNKMSPILQYAGDKNINILLLNETWQNSSIPGKYDSFTAAIKDVASSELLDFNCFSCPRPSGGRGGGVATLITSQLSSKVFSIQHNYSTFDCIFLIIKHLDTTFLLGNIYRPPSTVSFQVFMNEFSDLLMFLSYDRRPIILAGDFNIKINLPLNPNTSSFLELLSEFDLAPMAPPSATHVHGNILDFAIASSSLLPSFSSIAVDSSFTISDHFPLSFSILSSTNPSSSLPRTKKYRSYRYLDHSSFSSHLSESLSPLTTNPPTDIKSYLDIFNSTLTETLELFAPFQEKQFSSSEEPPWIDCEYKRARIQRRRYEKRGEKPAYYRQSKVCGRMYTQKKREYLSHQLKSWSSLKLISESCSKPSMSSLTKIKTSKFYHLTLTLKYLPVTSIMLFLTKSPTFVLNFLLLPLPLLLFPHLLFLLLPLSLLLFPVLLLLLPPFPINSLLLNPPALMNLNKSSLSMVSKPLPTTLFLLF